jgi:hypothetical protein
MPSIHMVCFSKDRAFQLGEFLRTFRQYAHLGDCEVSQSVLYRADESQFAKSYDKLKADFPRVNFVQETDFEVQLLELVRDTLADFVLFCVDDVLFYRGFDLSVAALFLHERAEHFAFHLKLHPAISFCHPANAPAKLPRFQVCVCVCV